MIGAAFVLGMGYLCSASVRLASSSNYVALARSRAAAESGLEHALYVLCSAPGTAATYTQSSPAGPYMLEGNVVYRHGEKTFDMHPGDALFFDAEAPHGPEELRKLPIRYLSVISYRRED